MTVSVARIRTSLTVKNHKVFTRYPANCLGLTCRNRVDLQAKWLPSELALVKALGKRIRDLEDYERLVSGAAQVTRESGESISTLNGYRNYSFRTKAK